MNLIFSYGINQDLEFNRAGHLFLGAAEEYEGSEVHVWLKKDCGFPEAHSERLLTVLEAASAERRNLQAQIETYLRN